ncbi:MAG: hypothetical protein IKF19_00605 [Bacilli bacterium]|nr:hypothetical protein [Bacilli bacterium]
MKKVFYLTLFVLFMLIDIDMVSAVSCDSEDMARLKGLAAGVSYNSEFIGDRSDVGDYQLYNVSFVGLTDEIYVSDSHYTFKVDNDQTVINVSSGITNYEIYSKNCSDWRLKTITIDLPKFNVYSVSDECEGLQNSDFEMCNPWYSGNIDGDYFYKAISEYKDKNNLYDDDGDDEDSLVEYIKYNRNIFIIGGLVLVVIIILIIFIRKKKNTLE